MAKKTRSDDDDILGPGAGHNSGDRPEDASYRVTSAELQSFIERYERLEADVKALRDDQKELMAEAKGRGYDTKVMRKVLAIRKRNADDLAEENAVLEMYLQALGMAS